MVLVCKFWIKIQIICNTWSCLLVSHGSQTLHRLLRDPGFGMHSHRFYWWRRWCWTFSASNPLLRICFFFAWNYAVETRVRHFSYRLLYPAETTEILLPVVMVTKIWRGVQDNIESLFVPLCLRKHVVFLIALQHHDEIERCRALGCYRSWTSRIKWLGCAWSFDGVTSRPKLDTSRESTVGPEDWKALQCT
jgi:hypothetical protein